MSHDFPESPFRPLKAVAFDLDGLLFNTEELYREVGAESLRRRGRDCPRELFDAMMGRPGKVALQIMIDWHGLDATVEELKSEADELFVDLLQTRLALMLGAGKLLEAIENAAIAKAITTSSGRAFVDNVLSRVDFAGRFDFILTGEDVADGKPHPEIYLTAARQFGIGADEMMVLEDSANGCRAAVAAGSYAVAVPSEHSRHHDFAGAAFLADSLYDVRIYRALGLPEP